MGIENSDIEKLTKSCLFRVYEINKKSYFNWLFENKSQRYSEDIIKCLIELFKFKNLDLNNIKLYINKTKYSLKYTIIAFRNFLNYCELFELIDIDLILKYRNKVKLNIKPNIDSFVPNKNLILKSLNEIENKYPQFLILYKIMIESGCRFTELQDFILNYNKSKIETYKDVVLYRNFYLRGKKSSYYIFMTKTTFNQLNIKLLNSKIINSFQILPKRNSNIINLKYLRKYNFTLMIENNISFEIANFIQGRTSQNIGFNHYLAKKTISVKEYSKILNSFYLN